MKIDYIIKNIARLEGYKKPKVYKDKIKLDSNENLAIPKEFIFEVVRKAAEVDVREYPITYDALVSDLAKYLNINKDCIAIGNGSDQIIDLILSTIGKGMSSVTIKPTFSFYITRCKLHSLDLKEIKLDENLSFNSNDIIKTNADICYISSPNNPTGNQFEKDKMIELIEGFNGLVIVDEAYAEFARYSLKDLVKKYENLIILRTMSKAFGLAGLRLGYAISNPSLIEVFNKIQYPYPVNSIAVNAARIVLSMKTKIMNIVEKVKKERDRVYEEILALNIKAFRSDANFIMFESNRKVFNRLIKEGIVIKDLGKINSKQCYRVTIADEEINDKFISALRRASL